MGSRRRTALTLLSVLMVDQSVLGSLDPLRRTVGPIGGAIVVLMAVLYGSAFVAQLRVAEVLVTAGRSIGNAALFLGVALPVWALG